jgi:hypothetical protein
LSQVFGGNAQIGSLEAHRTLKEHQGTRASDMDTGVRRARIGDSAANRRAHEGDKLHDTAPKPRGRVERFRAIALKFGNPLFSAGRIQLPGMATAHYSGEKFGDVHSLFARKVFDFDLKILRQEFAHEDRFVQ